MCPILFQQSSRKGRSREEERGVEGGTSARGRGRAKNPEPGGTRSKWRHRTAPNRDSATLFVVSSRLVLIHLIHQEGLSSASACNTHSAHLWTSASLLVFAVEGTLPSHAKSVHVVVRRVPNMPSRSFFNPPCSAPVDSGSRLQLYPRCSAQAPFQAYTAAARLSVFPSSNLQDLNPTLISGKAHARYSFRRQ